MRTACPQPEERATLYFLLRLVLVVPGAAVSAGQQVAAGSAPVLHHPVLPLAGAQRGGGVGAVGLVAGQCTGQRRSGDRDVVVRGEGGDGVVDATRPPDAVHRIRARVRETQSEASDLIRHLADAVGRVTDQTGAARHVGAETRGGPTDGVVAAAGPVAVATDVAGGAEGLKAIGRAVGVHAVAVLRDVAIRHGRAAQGAAGLAEAGADRSVGTDAAGVAVTTHAVAVQPAHLAVDALGASVPAVHIGLGAILDAVGAGAADGDADVVRAEATGADVAAGAAVERIVLEVDAHHGVDLAGHGAAGREGLVAAAVADTGHALRAVGAEESARAAIVVVGQRIHADQRARGVGAELLPLVGAGSDLLGGETLHATEVAEGQDGEQRTDQRETGHVILQLLSRHVKRADVVSLPKGPRTIRTPIVVTCCSSQL